MYNSDIVPLLTAVISGGATGYITNSIAVSMLFKKIFKRWGGVIEDNYLEFAEDMSKLVETDLLNSKTLLPAINSPDFKKEIFDCVKDVLTEYLPEYSGEKTLNDIQDCGTVIDNIIALLGKNDSFIIDSLFDVLGKKQLSGIISKEQFTVIVNKTIPVLISKLSSHSEQLKQTIKGCLSTKKINCLISGSAVDRIQKNITSIIESLDFKSCEREFDSTAQYLLNMLYDGKLITTIQDQLFEKTLSGILNDDSQILNFIYNKFSSFAISNDGQHFINGMAGIVLKKCECIDTNFSGIFEPAVKENITSFAKKEIPSILYEVSTLINMSRNDIETVIDGVIDRYFTAKTKSGLATNLKNNFIGNLSQKYKIVDKILLFFNAKSGYITEQSIKKISVSFDKIPIGHLFKRFIDDKSLSGGILHIIKKNTNREFKLNSKLLNTSLKSITGNIDLTVLQKVFPLFINILKDHCLYDASFKNKISVSLGNHIVKVSNTYSLDFINIPNITINEDTAKQKIFAFFDKYSSRNIEAIVNKDLINGIRLPYNQFWNYLKIQKLTTFYNFLQNKETYGFITESFSNLLNNNIDFLLTDNISKLAKNQMELLTPKEINLLVQDFIGRELKPINIFGAFLGAIAGVCTVFVCNIFGIVNTFMWQILAAYGIIFSFIGIATNWIAIKMLFRPYKKLFGINIPPFIGVVPKRKAEFAAGLSKIVKNYIMSTELLKGKFLHDDDEAKEHFYKYLSNSENFITSKILNNEKAINSICLSIFDILKCKIKNTPENAALFLEKLISKGIVTQVESSKTSVSIFKLLYMLNLQQNIPEFIIEKYENMKICDISTVEKIIDTGLNNIFLRLDEYLNIGNIRKLVLENENNILNWMERTSLNEIGIELEVLLTSIIENLLSQSTISKAAVNYLTDYVLNTGKTIKEILGDNTGILLDKAVNLIIGIIQTKASNNREKIKTYIIENIGDNSLLGILGGILAKTALKGDIDCIVDVLIDEELTKFLKTKSHMICNILGPMLYRKPADFGFTTGSIDKTKITQVIDAVLNTDEIKNNLKTVINIIAKELSGIPIKDLISLLGINNLDTLITKFEPVILSVLDYLKITLTASKNQTGIVKQINDILFVLLNEVTISTIIKNIDCKLELNNIIEIALNDAEIKKQLCDIIEESVRATSKETGIYDKKIFIKDISQFLSNTITENDLKILEIGMFNVLKCVFPKLDNAVTAAAKHDTLRSFLIPSVFDSFKRHFVNFIDILNVEKTIQAEVNSLPPMRIEKMFYKICGLYFRKITFYGWIGLFGGLLSYVLSLIL